MFVLARTFKHLLKTISGFSGISDSLMKYRVLRDNSEFQVV